MQRLCFISPDLERTRKAVNALRAAGVGGSNLMLIARSDIPLEELPAAGTGQTEATAGLARGLATGGMIGSLAGMLVIAFEDVGLAFGGGAIPRFALFGAGGSGLAALLAGASVSGSRLHRLQQAIQGEGKILLMVDVPAARAEALTGIVRQADPAVEFPGEERPTPLIPP